MTRYQLITCLFGMCCLIWGILLRHDLGKYNRVNQPTVVYSTPTDDQLAQWWFGADTDKQALKQRICK